MWGASVRSAIDRAHYSSIRTNALGPAQATVHLRKGWGQMFLGTYSPRLDDKSRLILPAKFRDRLLNGLVLTRGQERCLYLFELPEFTEVTQRARSAPMTNKAARDYLRVFLSGASDEIPDRQGRITLPVHLREYAGLHKELTIVGAGNRLEIWDAAAWQNYLSAQEQAFSEQDQEVIPGLF